VDLSFVTRAGSDARVSVRLDIIRLGQLYPQSRLLGVSLVTIA
jgi:hypothetical protein